MNTDTQTHIHKHTHTHTLPNHFVSNYINTFILTFYIGTPVESLGDDTDGVKHYINDQRYANIRIVIKCYLTGCLLHLNPGALYNVLLFVYSSACSANNSSRKSLQDSSRQRYIDMGRPIPDNLEHIEPVNINKQIVYVGLHDDDRDVDYTELQ